MKNLKLFYRKVLILSTVVVIVLLLILGLISLIDIIF
jgi:hypothetical protein